MGKCCKPFFVRMKGGEGHRKKEEVKGIQPVIYASETVICDTEGTREYKRVPGVHV